MKMGKSNKILNVIDLKKKSVFCYYPVVFSKQILFTKKYCSPMTSTG